MKKFKFSLFLLRLFLCGIIVYLLVSLFSQLGKVKKKKQALLDITNKIKVQEEKNQEMVTVSEVTDDAIEKKARENLEFSKNGERVFVVT